MVETVHESLRLSCGCPTIAGRLTSPLNLGALGRHQHYQSLAIVADFVTPSVIMAPTNPGQTTFTRETLVIRPEGFSPSIVTHAGILTSKNSISPYGLTSLSLLRSPTASWQKKNIRTLVDGLGCSPHVYEAYPPQTDCPIMKPWSLLLLQPAHAALKYYHIAGNELPHSDISGSQFIFQLPETYRRISRPSSPLSPK
ncbi:33622_t:CDS:2, partial [Racocetra persica]